MKKNKKANELRKILLLGEKVAEVPHIEFVADPTCIPSSEMKAR